MWGFHSISLLFKSLRDKSLFCCPILLHSPFLSPHGYSYRSVEHRGAFFQGDFHVIESNHFLPQKYASQWPGSLNQLFRKYYYLSVWKCISCTALLGIHLVHHIIYYLSSIRGSSGQCPFWSMSWAHYHHWTSRGYTKHNHEKTKLGKLSRRPKVFCLYLFSNRRV